jgi:pimeloyl-ACP methyl ester carboxylesterase
MAAMHAGLSIESRGSGGVPVLFVHSIVGSTRHWDAQLDHLRSKRRVAALDLSGHGGSPEAADTYTFRRLSDDIGRAADELRFDRFVLVGHSMGAAVAAEFAATHPDRVVALVLVDAPPSPSAVPKEQVDQINRALQTDPYAIIESFWSGGFLKNARPEVRARILADLHRLGRRAAIELTQDTFRFDTAAAARKFPGPKLAIVTPENDGPPSVHNNVAGMSKVVIHGTGHWIQLDAPDELNRALDSFLSSF